MFNFFKLSALSRARLSPVEEQPQMTESNAAGMSHCSCSEKIGLIQIIQFHSLDQKKKINLTNAIRLLGPLVPKESCRDNRVSEIPERTQLSAYLK